MAKNEERKVTISAEFRDRAVAGLQKLAQGLGLVRKDADATVRSGTLLGRALRTLEATATRTSRVMRSMVRGVADGFRAITRSLLSLNGMILGVLAGVVASRFVRAFGQVVNSLDEIAKTGQRLGFTAAQMQKLATAAQFAGVETEAVATAATQLQRRLADAARSGRGPAAAALRELGIAARDADGGVRDAIDVLPELADALAVVPRQGDRIRLSFALLEEAGAKLLPLLQQGGDEMRKLFGEVDRFAPALLNPETYALAERIADAFTRVQLALKGVAATIVEVLGSDIEGMLNRSAGWIADMAREARLFALAFREAFRGGSELGQRVAEQLNLMRRVLTGTLREIGRGVSIAVVEFTVYSLSALADQIGRVARFAGTQAAAGLAEGLSRMPLIGDAFRGFMAQDGRALEFVRALGELQKGLEDTAAATREHGFFAGFAESSNGIQLVKSNLVALRTTAVETFVDLRRAGQELSDQAIAAGEATERQAIAAESAVGRFLSSFRQSVGAAVEGFRTVEQAGQVVGARVGDSVLGISDALLDIVQKTSTASDALRQWAASLLADLGRIITRFTLLRLLTASPLGGLLGLTGAAAPTPGFNSGGLIPGRGANVDTVPAILTRGEYVQPRRAVDYYGPWLMEALRRLQIPRERLLSAVRGYNRGGMVAPTADQIISRYFTVSRPSIQGFNAGGLVAGSAAGAIRSQVQAAMIEAGIQAPRPQPTVAPVMVMDGPDWQAMVSGVRDRLLRDARFMQGVGKYR